MKFWEYLLLMLNLILIVTIATVFCLVLASIFCDPVIGKEVENVIEWIEWEEEPVLHVHIDKPLYITGPDMVSKPADIRDDYFYVKGCWIWKEAYKKNPRFYYYYRKGCSE
jgi:hypothetical protein